MQFFGWVAPSCVCTDIVLDGISSKLQCSIFCVKRIINRVLACAMMLILGKKWSLSVASYFSGTVVLGKGDSAKASSHHFALFRTLKI